MDIKPGEISSARLVYIQSHDQPMIGTIPVGASDDVGGEGGISVSSSVDKNQPTDPMSPSSRTNTALLNKGSSPQILWWTPLNLSEALCHRYAGSMRHERILMNLRMEQLHWFPRCAHRYAVEFEGPTKRRPALVSKERVDTIYFLEK